MLMVNANKLRMDNKRGGEALLRDFAASLAHPSFWAFATWLDVVTRYRRSRLGLVWIVVPPIMYVWGLGLFMASMQAGPAGDFIAYLGMGYLLYRVLLTGITDAGATLLAHQAFILDGHVRLTDFVLRVLAKAVFYFVMSLPILAVALAIAPGFQPMGLLLAIPAFAVILINLAWMATVVALAGARFPDINELVGSIFILSLLLTPIIWHASAAPFGTVRGTIMRINPLYHLIEIVRAPILGEVVLRSTIIYVAILTLAGWLLALVVYRRYARFVPLWM